ncbi:alkaline phosphatase [Shewanella sp. 202IG2-18]|uniref:alkaline phosphatase n=1 Tax=Parashewanella hymeniacidonis TaxID=2807618 RepID=UPI00195F93FF|nr:alkaline phosphatase [Parashewanella hymeniacidonis]MBM7072335.1 alkaline phosphatase [Parashewanella hymeniacidonis]
MKLTTKLAILSTSIALAACNGDDGKDGIDGASGADGKTSFVTQTVLEAGDAVCINGGVRTDSGLDSNGNAQLDADEITGTSHECKPVRESVSPTEIVNNTSNTWYVQGAQSVENAKMMATNAKNARGEAKNVILFVGDGMGVSTVTAARILEGQKKGMQGEENDLSFDKFPFAGLAKTYNVDAQTPDSAGTMTAMMSGVKTDAGVLGVDEDIQRGDCSTVAGNELVTAIELAEIAGLSTGVISTARITHATPAATFAKSADRNWEDVSDMPEAAVTAGCEDIASQLVNFETNLESRYQGLNINGLEVVMGGGRRHFLPKDANANSTDARSDIEGDRTDGRNLVNEWKSQYPTGNYVMDRAGFDALNPATTERIFGLFNESHMQYEADRHNDIAGEPSLTQMTEKALQVLSKNDKGYMLVVESGRIDHGHHAGNAFNALEDTIEFSNAVAKAVAMSNPEDTLIIVTADHSHVFTIAGYPKRGNPILGKVVAVGKTEPALASDDKPYTTLGYANGRGVMNLGTETNADAGYEQDIHMAGRIDLSDVNTEAAGFHQEALVPRSSETHAGEDVGMYAQGPSSQLVSGTNEQSIIFHIMEHAADLVGKAENKL